MRLLAAGADCTMMQPLLVPITSTQIEEERVTAVKTTQTHPCRNDCLGMNTKDEVQFTRSKNLSLSPSFCSEIAEGGGERKRQRRKKARRKWQRDIRKKGGGRKMWGGRGGGQCDRHRQAEEGRKIKGNLIDEKEEQEKGVAVRERSTLETRKCRAGLSERHGGDFRGILWWVKVRNAHSLTSQPSWLWHLIRSLCENEAAALQTSLKHLQDSLFWAHPDTWSQFCVCEWTHDRPTSSHHLLMCWTDMFP